VAVAPELHGVYVIYNGNEIIYIGRAIGIGVTIRSRLQDHLREVGIGSGTGYAYEITEYAATRERELLQEYQRLYGRLPRYNFVMP
jgi:hypothetical protein